MGQCLHRYPSINITQTLSIFDLAVPKIFQKYATPKRADCLIAGKYNDAEVPLCGVRAGVLLVRLEVKEIIGETGLQNYL